MEFVPNHAPFVVMAFLLTGLGLALTGIGFLYGLGAKQQVVVRLALLAALLVGGTYGVVWVGSALASHERTLGPGELKYFCEMDCHIAYSVTNVRTAPALGQGADATIASGTYYVVTLRTWFDPHTISTHRPLDVPLWPNPRQAVIVDRSGRLYRTSLAAQKVLDEPSVPLSQELRPGESYETRLVFDLPRDVKDPRLLIRDQDPMSILLIGHENSPLHRKVFFGLTTSS